MSSGGSFINQAIGGLVVRNMNVALLARMLQQQQVAGAAMVEMIEGNPQPGSRPAPQPVSTPSPAPQKGAPEPGKGGQVDVVA